MKRIFAPWMLALALPLTAQQPVTPAPAAQADKPVAVINGEVVTASQLDHMWDNLGTQMRTQYESSGGKGAFLENYLRKRLVLQEALKSGFDKRPDIVRFGPTGGCRNVHFRRDSWGGAQDVLLGALALGKLDFRLKQRNCLYACELVIALRGNG